MDMMNFVKTKHYELQVLVPFVGIWKPCAAPCPAMHIQMHNPAATAAHAEQK